NLAVRGRDTADDTVFAGSARGELHQPILLETTRREGYEMAVSRPPVVVKQVNGLKCEPYEALTVDVEDRHQGRVMEE
ncbi:translational GTPase TypA, partial [Bordetella holmesii]|nr:translational GTPase TypA [Bordetella holmesii]